MASRAEHQTLTDICRRLLPGLRLVILFGSVAAGKATNESDLDLAVLAADPLTQGERVLLIEQLALETGRPVDLIDLYSVGEPLLNQILLGGIRLFGSDERYAQLMMRNVMANEDFVPLQQRLLQERLDVWLKH